MANGTSALVLTKGHAKGMSKCSRRSLREQRAL